MYSALQSQYTVSAHLKSKHILPFGFARQYRLIARVCAWTICLIKTVQRCSLCGVRVVIEKCVTSCLIKRVQCCSLCGVLLLKRVYCLAAEGDLFSQERSPPVERVGVAGPHPYSSRKNKSPYWFSYLQIGEKESDPTPPPPHPKVKFISGIW